MDVSLVICTWNPRLEYFRRCLEGLRAQTLPRDRWELIIVDNDSETPLETNRNEWVGWHPAGQLVHEPAPGHTNARICGIRHSTAPLIVFCDDDNIFAPDYLETAIRLAAEFPHLGVLGAGKILPEYEEPPRDDVLLF